MVKRLSLLICSIFKRASSLGRLCQRIGNQLTPQTELLIETDDGSTPTGAKRNKLLERARGKYVAFIDDDDMVSLDYVPKILAATQANPDCCGMQGIILQHGTNPEVFEHSLRHPQWCQEKGVYLRYPNHLNPVRRSLALQVRFPEWRVREDRHFSDNIHHLLRTEVFIHGPIYFYYKGAIADPLSPPMPQLLDYATNEYAIQSHTAHLDPRYRHFDPPSDHDTGDENPSPDVPTCLAHSPQTEAMITDVALRLERYIRGYRSEWSEIQADKWPKEVREAIIASIEAKTFRDFMRQYASTFSYNRVITACAEDSSRDTLIAGATEDLLRRLK